MLSLHQQVAHFLNTSGVFRHFLAGQQFWFTIDQINLLLDLLLAIGQVENSKQISFMVLQIMHQIMRKVFPDQFLIIMS